MTNSQRGFAPIAIVLIIIAALAVGGGGYYIAKKHVESVRVAQSSKNQSPEPTVSVSSVPTSTPTISQSVSTLPKPTQKPTAKPTAKPSDATLPVTSYTRGEGTVITALPSQGWPIKLTSTIPIKARIESFVGFAPITVYPVTPVSGLFTLSISGFPANTNLYVYTNGYRNEEVKRSSATGTLIFSLPSNIGGDFIIKATRN